MNNASKDIISPPNYRDPSGEYLPISIEGLKTGVAPSIDLFARIGDSYFVVKPKSVDLREIQVTKFLDHGPYLYIRAQDKDTYYTNLSGALTQVIKDPSVGVREKAGILTDYAVEIVDQLNKDPGNPQMVGSAKNLSQEFVRFIGQGRQAFLHLVDLSSHDQYTYAHSVGVAAYTIALAAEVMHLSPEQMVDMGLAGLLHDIGKCQIDQNIINKAGALTEPEWNQMKRHPELGGDILRRHKNISSLVTLATEGHHENLIGNGYPKGLVASKLDPLVRIVSLADAFSALTTNRSYSNARDTMAAFKIIREQLDTKFDSELFKPFVRLFVAPAMSGSNGSGAPSSSSSDPKAA